MRISLCPSCDFSSAEERIFDDDMPYKGWVVHVSGLRHFVCPRCEAEFVDDSQTRQNLARLQTAAGEEPRFILGDSIRAWRESLFLTQRQAAKLFGGGPNAFSKYETGEIAPTEAMDNLLWLAMKWPGVATALATRRGVELNQQVKERCGILLSYSPFKFDETASFQVSVSAVESLERLFAVVEQTELRSELTFTHTAANEHSYSIEAAA